MLSYIFQCSSNPNESFCLCQWANLLLRCSHVAWCMANVERYGCVQESIVGKYTCLEISIVEKCIC